MKRQEKATGGHHIFVNSLRLPSRTFPKTRLKVDNPSLRHFVCLINVAMPQLNTFLTGSDLISNGPQTPSQKFYQTYATFIKLSNLAGQRAPQFYADNAVFHNQNGVDYHGAEIWPWIVRLFGQFKRLEHDFKKVWEIQNEDGSVDLITQLTRHIWAYGNNSDFPSISVPLAMVSRIGTSASAEAPEGLQFQEVWLYWDTSVLAPYFPKDAIVFRANNIFESK